MTDTTPKITFNDIVNLGKKRVDETTTVEVPALGGKVVLRQISGAEQDAAVVSGNVGGKFDQHAVAREQIKYSMVEPALPPDELNEDGSVKRSEANEILDNLPLQAFGQLQSLVQANSGLMPGVGVEQLAAMFRGADRAGGSDADGSAVDHAGDVDEPARVGDADADADDGAEGVLPSDAADAGDGGEAAGASGEAAAEAAGVTA